MHSYDKTSNICLAPVASDVSTAVSVMQKGRCSHYRQSFSNDEHIMGIVKAQQQRSIVIRHLKYFFFKMCLVHQLAIKCKSILHGGNIQEEITEADICGLHIFEFVFSPVYFFNCEDHKSCN